MLRGSKPLHFNLRGISGLIPIAFALSLCACAATKTQESTGGYIDDSAITSKVKTEVLENQSLKGLDVHVRTYKGVVELSGFVDNAKQATEAGEIAAHVGGVQSVQNNLIVKTKVAP